MVGRDSQDIAMILLEPDGYYTFLGVTKPTTTVAIEGKEPSTEANAIDEETIKKNYRKWSLKFHPDKGGDAEAFRLLNRAQKVLLNPKLRQQYDILGIDLDDDEEHHSEDEDGKEISSSQSIVQEIASNVLTGVIQVGVRTLMMGLVSVFVVHYRWTLYPALAFLAFIAFQIFRQSSKVPGGSIYDTIPPSLIAVGLILMHNASSSDLGWSLQFWIGETMVIGLFIYNSLSFMPKNIFVLGGLSVFSALAALWFRGRFWNYAIVIGLVFFVTVFVALAFPVMELVLESILNEKLKKVGERVRHHHKVLKNHYEKQISNSD